MLSEASGSDIAGGILLALMIMFVLWEIYFSFDWKGK